VAAALCAAAAGVQAAGPAFDVEAGVAERTLREWTSGGARLLREHGPVAQLRGTALFSPADRPVYALHLRLAQGRLNYDGQTQSGAPLRTHSDHTEVEAGAGWMPWSASAWGQLELGVDQLRFRRDIASTPLAQGLVETSSITFAGLTWRSPEWGATGPFRWHLEAGARTSLHHRLDVDFGGLFDASRLHGGERDELKLRAAASLRDGWTAALTWQHARQHASGTTILTRGGALAGSVQQPRLGIDDFLLTIGKSF
jgi:hypothetical protein